MKTEPNAPINQIFHGDGNVVTNDSSSSLVKAYLGLTKREYFAAMAMQGMCANQNLTANSHLEIARWSVGYADALIQAINK